YQRTALSLHPIAEAVRSAFEPFVELVKTWNLPDWLVHWGHPGNMAVVLFAMGGYGSYLGLRIRLSNDAEEKAKAKDLHPKLLGGMFLFFALGATGGMTALLTSDKSIFESFLASALPACLGTWSLPLHPPPPQPLLRPTLSLYESKELMTPRKSRLCGTMALPAHGPTIRCLASASLSSQLVDPPLWHCGTPSSPPPF
ncbi:hypothetical protein BHE74_00028683, partial [Ensete ventricosum]